MKIKMKTQQLKSIILVLNIQSPWLLPKTFRGQ